MLQQPHLIVEQFLGKVYCAVDFGEETINDRRRNPRPKRIAISNEDAALPLDVLKRLYASQIDEYAKPPNAERDKLLRKVEEKKQKLLKTLQGIIKTSNQDGEVQAAKGQWQRVTGKEYTCS